ncbi:MAG TPA: M20/M25/M40 family metallo-hydrolase [Vicinamibacterales bacterium]|nr:M20/M25/M40 family metallo-hydrolase [Vicinamibacterales bacterium]
MRTAAALMLLLALPLSAQEPVDRVMVEKIRREGMDNSRAYAIFNHLVDVIGPRLTATPEFKTAADWSRDQLAGWGLRDARLESFDFGRGWRLEKFTLEMIEPRYMPLVGYPEAWSAATSGEIEAAPIAIGDTSLDELEAMKNRLTGAILLSQPLQTSFVREDRPQPTAPGYAARPAQAQGGRGGRAGGGGESPAQRRSRILREAGPGVVLRTSRGEHGTMFVLGRDARENALPSVVVSSEHYNMILRMMAAGVPVKLRVNATSRYLDDDRNGYNVLAELPGVDPVLENEVVMIGAHLDSYHSAPGATDNADGSTIVLEAMRILTAVGAKPRRTIRVALWGGEEQGLLGSRAWVRRHLEGDANAAARDHFSVYFNVDPGTGPIYGWFLQGQENARGAMDAWLEPLRDLGARHNVLESIGSTDHLSFTAAGLPGFNPIQDYVDYDVRTHHTNVDSFERVREADLKQGAVVIASFAYHAAMRDGKMPRRSP